MITTSDVSTVAASAAKVDRRKVPRLILINEALNMVDFSEDAEILKWAYDRLCKVERMLQALETFGEREEIAEALFSKSSSPEEKRRAREWNRNHRQRIQNARKRISALKQIKQAKNKKKGLTPERGDTKKKKHTAGHVNEAWRGKGTSFAEYMLYYRRKDLEKNQEWIEEYLKPTETKLMVKHFENGQEIIEDAELFVIKKVNQINEALR